MASCFFLHFVEKNLQLRRIPPMTMPKNTLTHPTTLHRRDFGILTIGTIAAAFTPSIYAAPSPPPDWTPLWNGKNFDGWTTWLQRPERTSEVPEMEKDEKGRYTKAIGAERDPLKVFTIDPDCDGAAAIRISGECFGELRTTRSLENYHLKLQFKWGRKQWPPRNAPDTERDSGVLYHVHSAPGAEDRTWARSIEFQIQEGDVGDLYAVGSAIAVRAKVQAHSEPPSYIHDPSGIWTYFSQIPGQSGRCVKFIDAEKPSGQWNTLELICLGLDCIHIVNGKVVMRLHSPTRIDSDVPKPITSGPIILQSEGAEVFYRDIKFRPLTAIPSEFEP